MLMAKKGGRQTCFGIIEQVKSSAKREEGALDFLSFIFFVFLGPHPWHMEVPTLEAESELLPLAYTTAMAMPDGSLTHLARPGIEPASSWTLCRVLKPLSHKGNFFFFFFPKSVALIGKGYTKEFSPTVQ